MAFTTTRDNARRPLANDPQPCWPPPSRSPPFSFFCAAGSIAQVKAPSKNQLKAPAKAGPSEDPNVQPFAIGTDGSVAQQLISLRSTPPTPRPQPTRRQGRRPAQHKVTSSGRAICSRRAPASPSAW